jgi:hypothetical protein
LPSFFDVLPIGRMTSKASFHGQSWKEDSVYITQTPKSSMVIRPKKKKTPKVEVAAQQGLFEGQLILFAINLFVSLEISITNSCTT